MDPARLLLLLFLVLIPGIVPREAIAGSYEGLTAYRKGDYAAARAGFAGQAGGPVSDFFLALMHLRGEGASRNEAKGLELLHSSAGQGYFAARYQLGLVYWYGKGAPKDPARAKKLLAEAASDEDFRAIALRRIIERGSRGEKPDREAVTDAVKSAARRNNPAARYTLAFMHLIGDGVPKDVAQEVRWYKAASRSGSSRAAFMLALMYSYGDGVLRDPTEAARLMKLAAERGHVNARFFLGTFYYHGKGVPQDKKKAAEWIRKAAEQGDAEAQHAYGMLLLSGDGAPVDKDSAITWLGRSAKQGDPRAREALRELVSFRGDLSGRPSIDLPSSPPEYGKQSMEPPVRLEGKGVVLDQGDYSLKFSMPDLDDAFAPPVSSTGLAEALRTRLQGGKFELIFRPGK